MRLLFDLETDGFLEECTTIHCLVTYNLDTQELKSYADQSGYQAISEGIEQLKLATELAGHNIQSYDIPVLRKLTGFETTALIRDTLVLSRLIYAHMKAVDWNRRFKDMPIKLYGTHSLASWGHRLGDYKGDYSDWTKWTQEMQDYCEQDVLLNAKVYDRLTTKGYSEQAIELEHKFAACLDDMMLAGAPFDTERAVRLKDEVEPEMEALKKELEETIPPNVTYREFIPKRDNSKLGYKKGVPIIKKTETIFNPGSRPQIIRFLKKKHHWKPVDFTDKNNPKVDREVLESLTEWPEVPLLAQYLDMVKLMGALSRGEGSWLNYVKDGRIYGRINHNGAVTGRCTHFKPNLGQIPSARSYRGKECRELFAAPEGYVIVGCDAAGLELRMLGHYLHRLDGGAYAKQVTEGDVHTHNQEAAGLPDRDRAKTFIYAHNYGAGDQKLGSILAPTGSELEQKRLGCKLRETFQKKLPAIKQLVIDVKQKVKYKTPLRGLDGRELHPRGQHMALNTLLQGAGAVVMKQATVLLVGWLKEEELDAKLILHVHDEFQFLVRGDQAERVGELAEQSIEEAGNILKLKVPLAGEAKIGKTWAETH